jgi:hypothetical protein
MQELEAISPSAGFLELGTVWYILGVLLRQRYVIVQCGAAIEYNMGSQDPPQNLKSLLGNSQKTISEQPNRFLCTMAPRIVVVPFVTRWSSDNIFFSVLGVHWNPTSFAEFALVLQNLLMKARKAIWFLFIAQSWGLWTTRNKFTIEEVFPRQPHNVVFKLSMFMQL